jgi:hypothetical protein
MMNFVCLSKKKEKRRERNNCDGLHDFENNNNKSIKNYNGQPLYIHSHNIYTERAHAKDSNKIFKLFRI